MTYNSHTLINISEKMEQFKKTIPEYDLYTGGF